MFSCYQSWFAYDEATRNKARRKSNCEPVRIVNRCKDERFFKDRFSEFLMEEFGDYIPNKTIPFVFIDSNSQDIEHLNDDYAQQKFQENVKILLDFANAGEEFKLRTIDDMADENYRLMEEVEQLNTEVVKLNKSLIGEFFNIVVWENLSI